MNAEIHYLVIHEQAEDYDVEHPDDCQTQTLWIDRKGAAITSHTCDVGALLYHAGLDPLGNAPGGSWTNLPPGRYMLRAWTQHYPSTPYRGEEWDAGLEVVEERP